MVCVCFSVFFLCSFFFPRWRQEYKLESLAMGGASRAVYVYIRKCDDNEATTREGSFFLSSFFFADRRDVCITNVIIGHQSLTS